MGIRGAVLAVCMTGSVALHTSLLLAGSVDTPVASSGNGARTSGVQVRMAAAATPPSLVAATAAAGMPVEPSVRPTPPAAPASATAHVFDPDRLPPTGAGPQAHTDPAADPDTAYLPRSLLTRPPAPQQSIDLLYPELAPSGRFRAVVTLFIDERGVVQRVRIDKADDSGLPSVLEDATRQTFLRSAFAPGEIDGRPTRSQLRIEVEYATELLYGGASSAMR